MKKGTYALSYAVRLRVVAKYLGQLSVMLAILSLAPLVVSLIFGEYTLSLRYLVVIFILASLAGITFRLPAPSSIQNNEALAITALAFVLSPALMTYPMMGSGLSFIDALFEAVSAVTTTGLSTLASLDDMPRTFLFARAWMQWYGGLGVVVLSVALLLQNRSAVRRLLESASGENLITSSYLFARRMLYIYGILTLAGIALLWITLGDGFAALTHTLAAISTGGFSSYSGGAGEIDSWLARYGIALICLCGSVPLILYYHAVHQGWRRFFFDIEFRTLLLLVLIIGALLGYSIWRDTALDWQQSMAHAAFLGISAQTTAGFSTLDIGELSAFSMMLLILAMLIGGGAGSTAGGIKILRLLIVTNLLKMFMRRTAMPSHALSEPRLEGHLLEQEDIIRVLVIIALYIMVIFISWMVFLYFGYPAMESLFEVVSACATVGLSSGITTAELHPALKLVLCLDMIMGRLEIVAFLIIVFPRTWIGKRA